MYKKTDTYELLAKLGKTVTPAEAWVHNSLKNLVPGLRRDDEKGLFQEAQSTTIFSLYLGSAF